MRINREQFKKWLRALRSGKYSQTTGTLQDSIGYCCLGVACEILIPKKKLMYKEEFDEELGEDVVTKYMNGDMPVDQEYAPTWLKDIDEDFKERREDRSNLTELNDTKKLSFKDIADELELAYPERKKAKISTKKVLKKKK